MSNERSISIINKPENDNKKYYYLLPSGKEILISEPFDGFCTLCSRLIELGQTSKFLIRLSQTNKHFHDQVNNFWKRLLESDSIPADHMAGNSAEIVPIYQYSKRSRSEKAKQFVYEFERIIRNFACAISNNGINLNLVKFHTLRTSIKLSNIESFFLASKYFERSYQNKFLFNFITPGVIKFFNEVYHLVCFRCIIDRLVEMISKDFLSTKLENFDFSQLMVLIGFAQYGYLKNNIINKKLLNYIIRNMICENFDIDYNFHHYLKLIGHLIEKEVAIEDNVIEDFKNYLIDPYQPKFKLQLVELGNYQIFIFLINLLNDRGHIQLNEVSKLHSILKLCLSDTSGSFFLIHTIILCFKVINKNLFDLSNLSDKRHDDIYSKLKELYLKIKFDIRLDLKYRLHLDSIFFKDNPNQLDNKVVEFLKKHAYSLNPLSESVDSFEKSIVEIDSILTFQRKKYTLHPEQELWSDDLWHSHKELILQYVKKLINNLPLFLEVSDNIKNRVYQLILLGRELSFNEAEFNSLENYENLPLGFLIEKLKNESIENSVQNSIFRLLYHYYYDLLMHWGIDESGKEFFTEETIELMNWISSKMETDNISMEIFPPLFSLAAVLYGTVEEQTNNEWKEKISHWAMKLNQWFISNLKFIPQYNIWENIYLLLGIDSFVPKFNSEELFLFLNNSKEFIIQLLNYRNPYLDNNIIINYFKKAIFANIEPMPYDKNLVKIINLFFEMFKEYDFVCLVINWVLKLNEEDRLNVDKSVLEYIKDYLINKDPLHDESLELYKNFGDKESKSVCRFYLLSHFYENRIIDLDEKEYLEIILKLIPILEAYLPKNKI